MSDFEDKLNKLLNDPKEMERFAGFAKSLMGGGEPEQESAPMPVPEAGMLKKISGLMSGGGGSSRDEKLLEAMKPYLSERRRGKMDRAMKIARMAHLAELAAGEFGGGNDGDL